jgi:uncharacterized protein (DUF362 family)
MLADSVSQHTFTSAVGVVRLPSYAPTAEEGNDNSVDRALARLADTQGWSDERGPFSRVIPSGARVLIKPNLVLHQNEGPGGVECLTTHASIIRAVTDAALRSEAAEVLVGDAPIQGCNFDELLSNTGLGAWARRLMIEEPRFRGLRDFRRTTCVLVHGVRVAAENLQSEDRFVLFDLGSESLLEPISDSRNRFRVAWYDHRLMARTHHAGVHQYLLAKEVLDADVVINLPKLKTHKKAGVTCALKNLIGINGNKEFLPHHRIGGPKTGGDNYPDDGLLKRSLEFISDRQNLTSTYAGAMIWRIAFGVLARASRYRGDRIGMDGSWSGNDTIWRTCLDLNRILLYGRPDGAMANDIQRRVIHIADAVVAGQGNGPLAPDPLELGLLLGAENAAAMDWVGAQLLAYAPEKISLVRHAFDQFRWPIAKSSSSSVRMAGDLGAGAPQEILASIRPRVAHPVGWVDAATDTISPLTKRDGASTRLAAQSVEPQDA